MSTDDMGRSLRDLESAVRGVEDVLHTIHERIRGIDADVARLADRLDALPTARAPEKGAAA
jgi:hypothetical protein